jgi:hypothetical protein
MGQLQSIVIFLALVALAFAPWVWRKAREHDARRKCMTGPEMVAYLMYTEQCRGNRESLEHYERSPYIRAYWKGKAEQRMADWTRREGKLEHGRTDAAG